MARRKILISGATLLAALGAALTPTAAPAPGPGGVIDATRSFLQAIDRGDLAELRGALGDPLGQAYGVDGDGAVEQRDLREVKARFVDLGADEPIAAGSNADFAAALVAGLGPREGRRIETKIGSIVADCPAGNCSYAIVEFERRWVEGERKVVWPMRATALFRHTDAGFRLFHWHASFRTKGRVKR